MPRGLVKIWDPIIRIGHWTVVAAFTIAYLTEDDLLSIHVWAGYAVGAVVAARILWGFIGPPHARFSDFVYRPAAVFSYLLDLARFRGKRYLGHSPAGGAMVLALLFSLAATVTTGLAVYGAEKKAGPLAPFYAGAVPPGTSGPRSTLRRVADAETGGNAGGEESGKVEAESSLEELHELFANLTLILVLLHVGGVMLASVAHRENLVRAMITGWKRIEDAGRVGAGEPPGEPRR